MSDALTTPKAGAGETPAETPRRAPRRVSLPARDTAPSPVADTHAVQEAVQNDSLNVEVGHGPTGPQYIVLDGKTFQMKPFPLLYMQQVADAIATIPLIYMALAITDIDKDYTEAEPSRVAYVMTRLSSDNAVYTTDAVTTALPVLFYMLTEPVCLAMARILYYSLVRDPRFLLGNPQCLFQNEDEALRFIALHCDLPQFPIFLREIIRMNTGVYQRFLTQFAAGIPEVGVLAAQEKERQETQELLMKAEFMNQVRDITDAEALVEAVPKPETEAAPA